MKEHYNRLFRNLNSDKRSWDERTNFRAPHKPLLLLAVLDRFDEGQVTTNLIELSPDLGELFTLYWSRVFPPQTGKRGNIAMPFWHLQNDKFWHLLPRPGFEALVASSVKIHSVTRINEVCFGAKLDDELYALLQTENGRSELRHTLITTYFSEQVQEALLAQTAVNVAAFVYSEELLQQARQQQKRVKEANVAEPVRDQAFRRAIVRAYDHRCAICGVRILTADGHTAVAAAHIIPWSVSHNDDPRNGLALCHLCHWTFDEGLVTFSDRYQVKTSPQLVNIPNLPGHLLTFAGRGLIGPTEETLWPFVDSIRWHRQEVFRTR
ncbi:MAG: HNH endonuclease [Anaerolineae bacterium]|nr:HNH endonuclease [Anaerolineae bacterium]